MDFIALGDGEPDRFVSLCVMKKKKKEFDVVHDGKEKGVMF